MTEPEIKLRKKAPTRKDQIARRLVRDDRKQTGILPGLVAERERMFLERQRMLALQAELPTKICASTTKGTYRIGDGEVVQLVRPGSMLAYSLPSKGFGI